MKNCFVRGTCSTELCNCRNVASQIEDLSVKQGIETASLRCPVHRQASELLAGPNNYSQGLGFLFFFFLLCTVVCKEKPGHSS